MHMLPAEPRRIRIDMALVILLPPEEPPTARIHRMVPHMQQMEAQVRERVEPHGAIPADQVANHIGGEPVAAAHHVWEKSDTIGSTFFLFGRKEMERTGIVHPIECSLPGSNDSEPGMMVWRRGGVVRRCGVHRWIQIRNLRPLSLAFLQQHLLVPKLARRIPFTHPFRRCQR